MRLRVRCHLERVLDGDAHGWTALARRTGLPGPVVRRLRQPQANPPLAVAERLATALELPVEALWELEQ